MKRLFIILLLLISLNSYADFSDFYSSISDSITPDPNAGLTAFPIFNIPLGGKFESMATAYTAVSNDVSYLQSNPAGGASLTWTELSFSHNNWIADSNLEGILFTMRINDLGIGIGGKFLYTPFTEYNSWGERVSKGYYSESVATLNVSYNFFSNYYFYGLSLGTNVKIAYRNIPERIHPNQSSLIAAFDFGILTRFNLFKFYHSRERNFSIGAVVKNLGPKAIDDPLPSSFTAGISYSFIRPIMLAFDLDIPFSLWPEEYPPSRLSFSTGIDVVFTDFFSIQAGFSTIPNDRKNDPRRQGENRKNGGLLTKIGLNPRSGTNRPNLSVFNILQTGQIDQKKP
ncbi:MAG: UPF0164 family protein [bacterium]